MKFSAINFTCPSCGAAQKFSPETGKLTCEFCGTQTSINRSKQIIREYDFHEAVATLKAQEIKAITKNISCKKCGGSFILTPYSFSSNCPYCGTPAITDFIKEITPKSLIAFQITHKDAQMRFKKWIGSRWFAPNAFKKYLEGDETLIGYYLPYWTYDSDTISSYQGRRGDIYYVTVTKTVTSNGKSRQVQAQEPRIRWTPVSGVVNVNFDDITIGASKTLSHAILSSLEPWDTTKLVAFDEKYLLGFEAEEYTIALDNGFEFAKAKMSFTIKKHIRFDIGGDQQQIHSIQTRHEHVTYKNILLPLWTASFQWDNKEYRYAINAQTGKVVGKRPYSYVKIIFAILALLAVVGGLIYMDKNGIIQELFGSFIQSRSIMIPSY